MFFAIEGSRHTTLFALSDREQEVVVYDAIWTLKKVAELWKDGEYERQDAREEDNKA